MRTLYVKCNVESVALDHQTNPSEVRRKMAYGTTQVEPHSKKWDC